METKDVLIGIVIGLAIVWFLGGRQRTDTAALQIIQMQNRIEQLEYLLRQHPNHIQPPQLQPQSSYKNDEKWIILRGSNGFINSLRVIRDAETSAI